MRPINREIYVHYDRITGEILGFYHKNDNYIIPEPNMLFTELLYNLYFDNPTKHYIIQNNQLIEFENEDISLIDYKSLRSAKIIYEGRQRLSYPYSYEGNFYDSLYLKNNYFDQRFLEEISTNKSNAVKLLTINNRQVTMTSDEYLRFYNSYSEHIKSIYDEQVRLLDSILDADTKEEVDLVKWSDIDTIIYPEGSIFMPINNSTASYTIFNDAPSDGNKYVRQNSEWVSIL